MQDEAAQLIDDLVIPPEVALDGSNSINDALHTVAHNAPDDVKLQHHLKVDTYNPPEIK